MQNILIWSFYLPAKGHTATSERPWMGKAAGMKCSLKCSQFHGRVVVFRVTDLIKIQDLSLSPEDEAYGEN